MSLSVSNRNTPLVPSTEKKDEPATPSAAVEPSALQGTRPAVESSAAQTARAAATVARGYGELWVEAGVDILGDGLRLAKGNSGKGENLFGKASNAFNRASPLMGLGAGAYAAYRLPQSIDTVKQAYGAAQQLMSTSNLSDDAKHKALETLIVAGDTATINQTAALLATHGTEEGVKTVRGYQAARAALKEAAPTLASGEARAAAMKATLNALKAEAHGAAPKVAAQGAESAAAHVASRTATEVAEVAATKAAEKVAVGVVGRSVGRLVPGLNIGIAATDAGIAAATWKDPKTSLGERLSASAAAVGSAMCICPALVLPGMLIAVAGTSANAYFSSSREAADAAASRNN